MNKKSQGSKEFGQLIEDMFSPNTSVGEESYFVNKAGHVIAGVMQPNGHLGEARFIDNLGNGKRDLQQLADQLNAMRKGESPLREITPAEFSLYGIRPEQILAGKPPKVPKKPTKKSVLAGKTREVDPDEAEAGTVEYEPILKAPKAESKSSDRIKISQFLEHIHKAVDEQVKELLIKGGNPYDYYNENFSIFSRVPSKRN